MKSLFLLFLPSLPLAGLAAEFTPPASAEELIDILYAPLPASPQKAEDLWNQVPRLIRERDSLSGEKAAQAWFELFKKWGAKGTPKTKIDTPSLFAAIPAPNGWAALDGLVRDLQLKPEKAGIMLKLLTATLLGDQERQWALVEELSLLEPAQRKELERLYLALSKQTSDPAKLAVAFDRIAAGLEKTSSDSFGDYYWHVPDLISIAGEEKAAQILMRLFNLKAADIKFTSEKTRAFAQELLAERSAELQAVPWSIFEIKNDKDAAIFETLYSKFSDRAAGAILDYVSYRIKTGKPDLAAAIFENTPKYMSAVQYLSRDAASRFSTQKEKAGYHRFLQIMAERFPTDPMVWDALVRSSEQTEDSEKVLQQLAKTAEGIQEIGKKKATLARPLVDAELAKGNVEKAVELLWTQLSEQYGDEAATILGRLYHIAEVTENAELMHKVMDASAKMDPSTVRPSLLTPFLSELIKRKELDRAWQLACAIAERTLSETPSSQNSDRSLATLCELFVAQERGAEAIKLMEEAPWWSASQLRDLVSTDTWAGKKLGLVAADAFRQAQREQDAVGVLKCMIFRGVLKDDVFEKLVQLEGDRLLPYLDALVDADPFQERPLIWKAILLLKAEKLDEAEKAIRQAIAVDPSDGESGKNDRLRTYAVLADIFEAKGAANEAATARNVVKAVRMAEHADDLLAAGLRGKAIELYRTALTSFADAYCIQSRLAIQLANAGRMDEAIAHYEKAYELMPDSFGRIESHCFGCEKAFTGPAAQSLAEKTFQKLIAAKPESARLRYLLGYLRDNEERWKEAAGAYQEAVRLDPDYFNAWERLASVAPRAGLGFDIGQTALLNLLRLDPMGRHRSEEELRNVADLKQLWEIVQANAPRIRKIDTPFWFPMAASMEVRNTKRTAEYRRSGDPRKLFNPAEAILNQTIVKIAVESLTQAAK